jgi:hypothetical protein
MNKRLHRKANKLYPQVSFGLPLNPVRLLPEKRTEHIRCYFDHVHPLFPFLMREEFEQQVLDHEINDTLEQNTPFFTLYNAVLAIGSQVNGHGSFEPGVGISWQLFQASLSRLGELTGSKPCLLSVQVGTSRFARPYHKVSVTDTSTGSIGYGEWLSNTSTALRLIQSKTSLSSL